MKRLRIQLLPPRWDANPLWGYLWHYVCRYPFMHLGEHQQSTVSCTRTQLTVPGQGWNLQSWTKVLRHFSKTKAFKLTIILFFWMKTPFSSIVNPLPPKQCCKMLHWCVYLFPTLKQGERGEITTRENMMVISICLNNFCPWLWTTPPTASIKWLTSKQDKLL